MRTQIEASEQSLRTTLDQRIHCVERSLQETNTGMKEGFNGNADRRGLVTYWITSIRCCNYFAIQFKCVSAGHSQFTTGLDWCCLQRVWLSFIFGFFVVSFLVWSRWHLLVHAFVKVVFTASRFADLCGFCPCTAFVSVLVSSYEHVLSPKLLPSQLPHRV